MTARALAEHVNRDALYRPKGTGLGTFAYPVYTLDARVTYGRIHVQITPKGGEGVAWVEATHLTYTD